LWTDSENSEVRSQLIKPTIWREKERLEGQIVNCLTVIMKTKGCYWNNCLMCGFAKDSTDVSDEELLKQTEQIFQKIDEEKVDILKIFTSGSFLDFREIPKPVRDQIFNGAAEKGLKKIIVESRPEFITEKTVRNLADLDVEIEVGIGLESVSDRIREICINKGFSFQDFEKAARLLKTHGLKVKCYLLLKPPFLSEYEALKDAIESAEVVARKNLADTISLNLTNIQKGTLVERLWRSKLYRPPWLWSAVEVLKETSKLEVDIICDPVAAGKIRGPHNCRKCDGKVARAIRTFSLTQDTSYLENLDCECRIKWKKALELENYSRIPLFR
jgi:hypothetical protein